MQNCGVCGVQKRSHYEGKKGERAFPPFSEQRDLGNLDEQAGRRGKSYHVHTVKSKGVYNLYNGQKLPPIKIIFTRRIVYNADGGA